MRLLRFVGARLHRRLFVWFGVTIVLISLVAGMIMHVDPHARGSGIDLGRIKAFAAARFASVWDEPGERDELARQVAHTFEVRLRLRGADGALLSDQGGSCHGPTFDLPVERGTGVLGSVEVCRAVPGRGAWGLLALAGAGLTVWLASAFIARRITRPLGDLVRVTREIGQGKVASRVRLHPHEPDELGRLAEAINDMASRIEQQTKDQRALLAAVSHEIRTPLGHIRVLTELGRERSTAQAELTKIEQEVTEIDALVDKLLASSRLDFTALSLRKLKAAELVTRALERAGQGCPVEDSAGDLTFLGDATLLVRAIENLIDNARRHGGGLRRIRIEARDQLLVYSVCDSGLGFSDATIKRAFDPFQRGQPGSESLGLGLALVRRIALAHGGKAWAENRSEGGACVSFSVSTASRSVG